MFNNWIHRNIKYFVTSFKYKKPEIYPAFYMLVNENDLDEIFTESMFRSKTTLKEKNINQCTKEDSLEKAVAQNFKNKDLEGTCIKINESSKKQNGPIDTCPTGIDDKIYIFNDEISLDGLYNQIDLINKDILSGFDLSKYQEEFKNDMYDVYATKNVIKQTKESDLVKNNLYKCNDIDTENIDVQTNMENVSALFNALKNAQFKSAELKGKVFQFIHNEIYKIESKYTIEMDKIREERDALKTEFDKHLKINQQKIFEIEHECFVELNKLKEQHELFKKDVCANVKRHLEEWKNQAQQQINEHLNHK